MGPVTKLNPNLLTLSTQLSRVARWQVFNTQHLANIAWAFVFLKFSRFHKLSLVIQPPARERDLA